jgi:alpha-ribazole phosphatase
VVSGAQGALWVLADTALDSLARGAAALDVSSVHGHAPYLWVIRHAQPLVAKGVCYGASNIAADPAATDEAALALAKVLPLGISVSCSPLLRCEQLMTALRRHRADLSFKTEPRITEMDFGVWEMQRWDDISPAELAAWTDGFAHYRVGGSGESVAMVMERVEAALGAVLDSAAWITHAGVSCALALLAQRRQLLAGEAHRAIRASGWPAASLGLGQWRRFALCPAQSRAG